MSVTVDFDPQDIYSKIQKSTDVALYEIGGKIIQDTDHLVPMNSGLLRSTASLDEISKNNIQISYSRELDGYGDIAQDVYNGMNPVTGKPYKQWTTPGTTSHWFEVSKEQNLDSWIEYFRERTKEIWRRRKQKY